MNIILITFALLTSVTALAQNQNEKSSNVPAKVTNWGNVGLMYSGNFFDETKDTIIAQIGAEEFEKVKMYSKVFKWPRAMQRKIGRMTDEEKKTLHDKLD